jgi:hypothetical protein
MTFFKLSKYKAKHILIADIIIYNMDNEKYLHYKKKYIKLKQNKIDRSGIILIEKSYNNQPAIILFKGKSMCADGGGKMDKQDKSLQHTAVRELIEESANLFRLNVNMLKSHLSYTNNNRVIYFVGIDNNINISYFEDNRKLISQFDIPQSWKETTQIHKFYISDLKKMDLTIPGHLNNVTDADGNQNLIIMERVKDCIRDKLFTLEKQIQYTHLHENLNFQEGSDKFLYGTKCYQK